jgi:pyruvate dehydrogenase E2 component (dihydrolipoamide acetyltransferase)
MEGGTITITNLGDNGADRVFGVIFPPQVALVGFGRIRQQAVIVEDAVVSRPVVDATLSADHRATDGATGSRFLTRLNHHLQNPEKL